MTAGFVVGDRASVMLTELASGDGVIREGVVVALDGDRVRLRVGGSESSWTAGRLREHRDLCLRAELQDAWARARRK